MNAGLLLIGEPYLNFNYSRSRLIDISDIAVIYTAKDIFIYANSEIEFL